MRLVFAPGIESLKLAALPLPYTNANAFKPAHSVYLRIYGDDAATMTPLFTSYRPQPSQSDWLPMSVPAYSFTP